MTLPRRRALLSAAALSLGALAACNGESSLVATAPPPPPTPPPPPLTWTVPAVSIDIGKPVDLAPTLPASIVRGGSFSVSPTGSALPAGVSLSPAGVLSATTPGVSATGVVFRYVEP